MKNMDVITKATLTGEPTTDNIIQCLLVGRGLITKKEQSDFLSPTLVDLDYLYNHSGINQEILKDGQSLLDDHLKQNNDICIFGDYDADGITATAVMYLGLSEYIKHKGSKSRLLPFIPDRHKHGYGISQKAVDEVLSGEAFKLKTQQKFNPKLILTVDTGIVAHVGIQSFRNADIDVIITDHHMMDNSLPNATHVIHTTTTSGAGISWIFVSHLLGNTSSYLDLATVGIVADMMPLVGFNRSLVTKGLTKLSSSTNLGFKALRDRMGIKARSLTTYDISFGIAPRINAAGRIYSPLDALRLLCTNDEKTARELAEKIESHNLDRQVLTDQALSHALSQDHIHKIITLIGPYHEGVIGLVAGKLVEQLSRPAIVLSENGEIIKGSARSIPGFNITGFLRSLNTAFLGLGGHDQAAGFSIAKDHLNQLISEVNQLGDKVISDELLVKHEFADLELPLSASTLTLAKELTKLEPYGLGNTKPRFLFKDLTVLEDRALGDTGKHHKLIIEQGGVTRPLLMFNTKNTHPINKLKQCVAGIDVNVWNNKESVQLVANYVEA
ncbi:MAG: hypothetical protein Fur0011_0120 [Candidatus Microgenomates bacterium]